MATSYQECYNSFLAHINDIELLYPLNGETEAEYQLRIDTILFETFKLAVPKFFYAVTSLEREDVTQTFLNNLRPIEIEIIGLLMVKEYYRKQLNFLVALKHSFSDKDWKSHDKSNQMNQYRQIVKEMDDEVNDLILKNSYTSSTGRLQEWDGSSGS